MKKKEIKTKSKQELETRLGEMRKELIKLNQQVATGTTLKSPGQIRKLKKNIAKIMTQLNTK